MRIVIDMQGAQTESRFRGIGRYTLSFAQAIVRNRGEHEVFLALSGLLPEPIESIRAAFDGLLPHENIRVWYAPGPVAEGHPGNQTRREVAELIREAFLASLAADVIHITSLFEGYVDDAVTSIGRFHRSTPVSVSLYDLIPLLNPDHYLKPNPRFAQYFQRKIDHLKKATCLLAISEFTRQEGLEYLDTPANCVANVSTAIEPCFCPQQIDEATNAQLRQKFGLNNAFVLYTGGSDERKNLPRFIQAYAALPLALRANHQLLLAGKMPEGSIAEFKHIAKSVGLKPGELCFSGYVTDKELIQLYNLCNLFVFPSWHEGFGLPALEAMACGAPVVSANTSSLPEVIGFHSALFDPFDITAITSKMVQALEDDGFRAMLREHGLQQAKKFSWDEVAKRSINAFEEHAQQQSRSDVNKTDATNKIVPDLLSAVACLSCSEALSDINLLPVAAAIALNHPEPRRHRKLFVDVSELVQRDARTGVQRVTRSILRELLLSPPIGYKVEAVYANINDTGYRLANNFTQRFLKRESSDVPDDPIEIQPCDIFLGLDLQHHVVSAQNNYFKQLSLHGVKIYFVIYDLLPIIHPQAFPPGVCELHIEWLKQVTQFDGAICISKSVADELADWLKKNGRCRLRPFRIEWFHLGADIQNPAPSHVMSDEMIEVLCLLQLHPSFLMVGTIEPRKGYSQVLEAFDQVWQNGTDVNLVIVGKQGWLEESLARRLRTHPKLGKHLFWLEGISDEYLEKVYAASTCLIAASYGEGFGLPLIEAAHHKLPIIARNIPVFKEVAGEHAYYFADDISPATISTAIRQWLELYCSNLHQKSDDMPWLTWKQSARQLSRTMFVAAIEN
ncbi:MAG: glycosyltransferase family 4 protein [Deltaproteobacteria bacterium]|nr:glycosyltransferase family 4 protein [Deltaproteobacteria bacterium]